MPNPCLTGCRSGKAQRHGPHNAFTWWGRPPLPPLAARASASPSSSLETSVLGGPPAGAHHRGLVKDDLFSFWAPNAIAPAQGWRLRFSCLLSSAKKRRQSAYALHVG